MASTVGILSKGIKLSYATIPSGSTEPTYTALDNLQEIPDLGQAPEQVDVTCLADANRRSINGLVDFGTLEFTFLYDSSVFNTLKGMEGTAKRWQIELGDAQTGTGTHHGAKFTWDGIPSVSLAGAAVNGALQFKLSISVSSNMSFDAAA